MSALAALIVTCFLPDVRLETRRSRAAAVKA